MFAYGNPVITYQTPISDMTTLYWWSAVVTALIDMVLFSILVWRIKTPRFQQLARPIAVVGIVFWIAIWMLFLWWGYTWEKCYQYVFPSWAPWIVPLVYGVIFGLAAGASWWLALRLPIHPMISYSVLGGLASLPGHLQAIYGGAMLERCVLIQGLDAAAALIFGVFEFGFYWLFILGAAALAQWGWARLKPAHS
jgi:hypothetical protein